MRLRTIVTACVTAPLLACLAPASAAEAGTGSSTNCSDGTGGTEYVIDDTLVTVAVETSPNTLMVCYSTAGSGTDGQVTGGRIDVFYAATILSPSPTATTIARCSTDYQFGIAPLCLTYAFVTTDTNNILVTPYPNYVCALYIGSVCQAWAPGATVATGSPNPFVSVDTFGVYVPVTVPGNCVALFVTPCP